jgi:hypothetical protein
MPKRLAVSTRPAYTDEYHNGWQAGRDYEVRILRLFTDDDADYQYIRLLSPAQYDGILAVFHCALRRAYDDDYAKEWRSHYYCKGFREYLRDTYTKLCEKPPTLR